MATRTRRRVDRIRANISILQVLSDFGYQVRPDGGDREQQFSCDLHGDGVDNKPSARVYPQTSTWYCFCCDRLRDAIETVKAKKGLKFGEALSFLEQQYGLKPLPWEAEDERPLSASEEIYQSFNQHKSFPDDVFRFKAALTSTTKDRDCLMDDVLVFWDALDHLVWLVKEQKISELKAQTALLSLEQLLIKMLNTGTRNE